MKNKKDLWILAVALVSILFIAILFIVSGASKSGTQEDADQTIALEDETASKEEEAALQTGENTASQVDGAFTFSADSFAKSFEKELPQGYSFSETMMANPERDNRMQLDILDESGAPTDIAIVFDGENTERTCSQMALTIKADCIPDDADSLLKWYLFTFLKGYTEEKKKAIYDDYLYLFDTGAQDYRVYTEETVTTMISCETEEAGTYYYVMVSAE